MFRFFKSFFGVVFFIVFLLWVFDYGYIIRGIKSTYLRFEKSAQVDDSKFFYNDTILKSSNPFVWPKSISYNKKPLSKKLRNTLERYKTHSFLVIKNDSLFFEEYWDEFGVDNNKSNSFSMAKSIVSLLVAGAIQDGFVSGLDHPVKDVFPNMSFFSKKKDVSIGDLLNMSSGLVWEENYFNPFNITARSYLTKNLTELSLGLSFGSEPGVSFVYQSGATQIASLMLESILKNNGYSTISEYAQNKLWDYVGAENNALWSLDDFGGVVKGFCCFHSNAKDFAKIGRLFLKKGRFNNKPAFFNNEYFNAVTNGGLVDFYSYGWWRGEFLGSSFFYMRGFLGQFVVVVPDKDLIIVRLGRKNLRNKENPDLPTKPFEVYVTEVLNLFS